MATKVRSTPINYTRSSIVNDASRVDSLELTDESPSEYEFDISTLNGIDIKSDVRNSDKGVLLINDNKYERSRNHVASNSLLIQKEESGILDFLQELNTQAGNSTKECFKLESENQSSMAPTLSCESSILSSVPVAEKRFKSNTNLKVLNDSCFDLDSALTDIFLDIAETPVSCKPTRSINKSNFSGLSFSPSNDCFLNKLKKEPVNDVVDDDLTFLLDSCNSHNLQPSKYTEDLFNDVLGNSTGICKENSSEIANYSQEHEDLTLKVFIPSNTNNELVADITVDDDLLALLDSCNNHHVQKSSSSEIDLLSDLYCNLTDDVKGISSRAVNHYQKDQNDHKKNTEPVAAIDDDLIALLNSCKDQYLQKSSSSCINFVSSLSSNLSDNIGRKFSKHVSDCKVYEDPSFDIFVSPENILSKGNSVCSNSNLITSLSDNLKYKSSVNKALIGNDKKSPNDSDDDILPDIDLNFCIKNSKNKCLSSKGIIIGDSSPQSNDSGFDESNFDSASSSLSFKDFYSFESAYSFEKDFKSALNHPKPSLLSKAISCKPKTDKIKIETLKNIREMLVKKSFPFTFTHCKNQEVSQMSERIEDQSNQCVITTRYFKVPDI